MPDSTDDLRPDLRGSTVVVTRAMSQAQGLCELVRDCNGVPLALPALEIQWLPLTAKQQQSLTASRNRRPSLMIFTSVNAVASVARQLESNQRTLDADATCIAIGAATAARLRELGVSVEVAERATSEGLAQMPVLAEADDRELILIRGEGGREILAPLLQKNGWIVNEIVGYRRRLPRLDVKPMFDQWRSRQVVFVTFMSGDTARNLVKMARSLGQSQLDLARSTPAVVISERVGDCVRSLGWQAPIVVARTTSAQAMLAAVESLSGKT